MILWRSVFSGGLASVPTDDMAWVWVPVIAGIAFFVGAWLLWLVFRKMMSQGPSDDE
jgi:H+/Cl- antiporter ClcA